MRPISRKFPGGAKICESRTQVRRCANRQIDVRRGAFTLIAPFLQREQSSGGIIRIEKLLPIYQHVSNDDPFPMFNRRAVKKEIGDVFIARAPHIEERLGETIWV